MARLDFGSRELVEQSAQAGGNDALFQLGLMYSAGRDVEQDLIAAHKWFNLAALRGHEQAGFLRQEVASEMTRPQITKAQRQARQWLSKHEPKKVAVDRSKITMHELIATAAADLKNRSSVTRLVAAG